jgi:hypothetical protein
MTAERLDMIAWGVIAYFAVRGYLFIFWQWPYRQSLSSWRLAWQGIALLHLMGVVVVCFVWAVCRVWGIGG